MKPATYWRSLNAIQYEDFAELRADYEQLATDLELERKRLAMAEKLIRADAIDFYGNDQAPQFYVFTGKSEIYKPTLTAALDAAIAEEQS